MKTDLQRRNMVVGSAIGAFALAVRPVSAATLHTPDTGLAAGMVSIPAGDRSIPAYRARPVGKGPFPVILVVHEIFGVHEYIRDVCRRLALQGYLAIAPDLYVRQGDVSNEANIQDIITKVVSRVPDAQVLADLDATLAWSATQGGQGRAGITGFCWGGRIVWLYSAHQPRVAAGAAWYGRLQGATSALSPRQPVDLAAELNGPVLGLYGGKDEGISLTDIEAMRGAIAAAKGSSQIEVYADAAHGFHADYRPSYRAEAATEAWSHALAWFAKHGVGT